MEKYLDIIAENVQQLESDNTIMDKLAAVVDYLDGAALAAAMNAHGIQTPVQFSQDAAAQETRRKYRKELLQRFCY
jgi:hypothetical protein